MKNLKVATGILSIAFVTLTAMSCKSETKQTDSNENMHTMEADHHNDESQDHASMNHESTSQDINFETTNQKNPATTPIIDAYLQIKNGLVADSKDDAAHGAKTLLVAFSAFDMTKLNEDKHKAYMEILESAKEHAEHIVKSPIDHQREHFEALSTDINDMVALLGTEKTLYKDFCPMANNNKGAYWLSEVKDIKNPYFGSKMLKCGSVKKQIN
jgi:hypothetical protein